MKDQTENSSPWELLGDTPIEDFGIFQTRKSKRKNPRTGKSYDFFLIDGMHWTNIVALTATNEIVLVKQYRHGSEQMTLELPGGIVEKGEDPKCAALRELQEESGYYAEEAEELGTLVANPAMMSTRCFLYVARNAVLKGGTALDPGEDIETVLLPLTTMIEMIKTGEISHSLHVAAIGLGLMKGLL